ncbi:MAG: N-acetylmuramidase [Alphaproteobacteria bacterium]|nr:N-acetylmuramidase [Alphaproteobacteria bacterium]
MHPRIDEILDEILKTEGGFVDDPDDPGGATNHGISLRYARKRGIVFDLDGDGDVDADDILLVTPELARKFYLLDFYETPKIDHLPLDLQAVVFDMAINAGPERAVMLLQEVLNDVREVAPDIGMKAIAEDGKIGPRTLYAMHQAHQVMGPWLVNAYVDARIGYYRYLAERNPKFRKYVVNRRGGPGGWIVRAENFRVET